MSTKTKIHFATVFFSFLLLLCLFIFNSAPRRIEEGAFRGGEQGFPWAFRRYGYQFPQETEVNEFRQLALLADIGVGLVILIVFAFCFESLLRFFEESGDPFHRRSNPDH